MGMIKADAEGKLTKSEYQDLSGYISSWSMFLRREVMKRLSKCGCKFTGLEMVLL